MIAGFEAMNCVERRCLWVSCRPSFNRSSSFQGMQEGSFVHHGKQGPANELPDDMQQFQGALIMRTTGG